MSEVFKPGLHYSAQGVHIGSQSLNLQEIQTTPSEQAYEGRHLAACHDGEVIVTRMDLIDPTYVKYWENLINGHVTVVSPTINGKDGCLPNLSELVLDDSSTLDKIRASLSDTASLVVFNPTELEADIARRLEIPLWGTPTITEKYGSKSGGRLLAEECSIPLAPGFVSSDINNLPELLSSLRTQGHDQGVIKLDESTGGMGHWRINFDDYSIQQLKSQIEADGYSNGNLFVVEAWMEKSSVIGCHLELTPDEEVIIAFAWQQLIAADGISYVGAIPLDLPEAQFNQLITHLSSLGSALLEKGAIGSYGPDFMVVGKNLVLNELNARVPATAFPAEIALQIRGEIGDGFIASHITVPPKSKFEDIARILSDNKLLVTQPDSQASGVVPFNVGLLPWGKFDIVALAPDLAEAQSLVEKTKQSLHDSTH